MEGAHSESQNQTPKTPDQAEKDRLARIMAQQDAMFKKMEAGAKKANERGQNSWQDRADLNN